MPETYTKNKNIGIVDGTNSSIKATVFDYTNSNPAAVRLTDTNGDYTSTFAITFDDMLINGTIDAVSETIEIDTSGLGSCGIQVSGTWAGGIEFEGTVDGTNWTQTRAVQFGGTLVGGTAVNGLFFSQIGGLLKFRLRSSTWTSGTATIYLEATTATNAITLANALPTGTNSIGQVTANAGTNLNTSLLATESKQDNIITAINTISGLQISTNMEGGGKISVGTTAVEVTFTGTTKSIILSADSSNTGELYVGKSNVTSAGANAIAFILPGEMLRFSYDDVTNPVYIVASAASQNFYKGALL